MYISISLKARYFLPWSIAADAPAVVDDKFCDEPRGI